MELERKWLVVSPPADALAAPADAIDQGYLVIGAGGTEARVRRRAGRCTLTVKAGTGRSRDEYEISLSEDQFKVLWPATEGQRVVKSRRVLWDPERAATIELDVYAGDLDGLIVAEIEFPDEPAAAAFSAPDWFGTEVTDDDRYKNRRLAVDGRPEG